MERHAQQVTQSPANALAGRRTALLLWALVLTALVALASVLLSDDLDEYNPRVGTPGKDVLWAPTPPDVVEHMLDMAKELFDLVRAGKIVGEPKQIFALEDAAEAHRALESRSTSGATVLIP